MVTDQYVAAYNIILVATFLVQNRMVWIELAASRMIEDTTIYKKMRNHWWHIWSSIDALIAMVWQRMDSIIHMYLEKMRYHEIHQNKPNQVNYSFFDIYRTNLIQHNNQPIYGINVWWLFRVENHFIKCYGCDLLFCTYKIRWTKLRCLSW